MTPLCTSSDQSAWTDSVHRVAAELVRLGHPHPPTWLTESARTAQEAADALGVSLGQIAKSVVFRRKPDGVAVLVVTAGDRRVDERKVAALVCPEGHKLGRADAEFVKAQTGFSIGGVSPVAHAHAPVTVLDASLQRFNLIWAAAGHPNAVFPLEVAHLPSLTGAQWADVVEGA